MKKKQIRNISTDISWHYNISKIFGDINNNISGIRYGFFFEDIRLKIELTLRDNLCDAIYDANKR